MLYRALGRTGLRVSVVAFGAGPVAGLMTGALPDAAAEVLARAVAGGVNWIDTAAGYGQGRSEELVGEACRRLPDPDAVHVATKVRLLLNGSETDLRPLVRDSVRASLRRLGRPRVSLLQVHNAITSRRNDEPTSLTPEDVLGAKGIGAAAEDLRAEGLVDHLGITGLGEPAALRMVIQSGRFETIQTPFHLLNPSALLPVPDDFPETNYGRILVDAAAAGMGIFAIRVFAAGALLDATPSSHTLTTPFFPLPLYERDRAAMRARKGDSPNAVEQALRFVLERPEISSAIVGFGTTDHVDEALRVADSLPS